MKKTSNTKGKLANSPTSNTDKAVAQVKIPINRTADQARLLNPKQQKQLADWQAEQIDEEEAA
jgi:hypothetical protein